MTLMITTRVAPACLMATLSLIMPACGDDADPGTAPDGSVAADAGISPDSSEDQAPLDKALAALGGQDRIASLRSLAIATAGERWMPDEGYMPNDAPFSAGTFELEVTIDLAADSYRLDYRRHIQTLTAMAETQFSEILVGQLGVIAGSESIYGIAGGDMLSDRWASIRTQQRLLSPHLLLREVIGDPARVLDDTGRIVIDGRTYHLLVLAADPAPITLRIDAETGLVASAVLTESDPLRRDVTLEVRYGAFGSLSADGLAPPLIPRAMELYRAVSDAAIATPELAIAGGHGIGTVSFAALEAALGQ